MKHLSLVLLALFGLSNPGFSQDYCLTVESADASAVAGATTYRFYVNSADATDKISAVFGNDLAAWEVNAPDGVFNSPMSATWNASGVNPAFLAVFPDLADDSYATIGLEGPASTSGITGAADPSIVEDADQPVSPFFQTEGATELLSNTVTGSAVYVLNTATNALPDSAGRWLVMQITTTGEISGQVNYQVFPLGVGADDIWFSTPFDGAGDFCGDEVEIIRGCKDPEACNYNPEANLEPIDPLDPDACNDRDECGNCDGTETGPGIPDGECDCDGNVIDQCDVCGGDGTSCEGCISAAACNYDPDATIDDGSCIYAGSGCECDDEGGLTNDTDGDGICDFVDDCIDTDADDICDDVDDCVDVDADDVCDNEDDCVGELDSCGVCNGPGEVYECGCTDIPDGDCDCEGNQLDACGVCNGPGEIYECGCADIPEGDCDCEGNQLDALGVCGGDCTADADMDGICDDVDACVGEYDAAGVCNGNCFAADSTGTCLEIYIYGCLDSLACNYVDTANTDDLSCLYNDVLGVCGGDCFEADSTGTCLEIYIYGCLDSLACNFAEDANTDDGSCDYSCLGCMDELACNYDSTATIDSGMCELPGDACDDMDDTTTNDAISENCECVGETIVEGCTDEGACNYNPEANVDDGSCEYESCAGCTDQTACNYDETATIDDDSCVLVGDSCDDGNDATEDDTIDENCDCVGVPVDGIEEASMLSFGMFPNPTTGEVTLQVDGFHAGVAMQVMDGAGRVVWSEQNLALRGNTVFDLSALSTGTYNVMLSDERGISVKRLTIQR